MEAEVSLRGDKTDTLVAFSGDVKLQLRSGFCWAKYL